MKKYIITAGGSLEKWDSVRGHTNLAKGTIGTLIAKELVKKGNHVTFVHGYFTSPIHNTENIENVVFEGVEHLKQTLKQLLTSSAFDGIIMTAALSDWLVDEIYDKEGNLLGEQGKLSSNEPPIIKFKKAPKILPLIKTWDENITLVGFKLESNVSEEEVIKRANTRMQQSNCDLMIANFSQSLYNETAPHFIVEQSGKVLTRCDSKKETAEKLAEILSN